MTDEEINRVIDEFLGWEKCKRCDDKDCAYNQNKNYCNDLNAMHEAYSTMTEDKQWEFIKTLVNYQQGSFPLLSRSESLVLANATARQRAEAFLRTVGKWKETK
jgi:peroxiredoxin